MTITSNDPLAIERAQEIDRLRVDLDREQKKRSALELSLIHLREAVSLPRDFSQRDSQIETAWVEAGEALYGPMGEWVRRSELEAAQKANAEMRTLLVRVCCDERRKPLRRWPDEIREQIYMAVNSKSVGNFIHRSDVAPIVEALLDLANIAAPYCADRPKVIVALAAIKTLGITPTNK
jgi:hypothetical protein